MTKWLKDDNGNKCDVEWFGSKEAAQKALDSLKNCENCTNCSGCSDCSRCSGCSDCSDCSRCSDCSDCLGCSRCSGLKDTTPATGESTKPPTVPTIPNIHAAIYAAASQPRSLEMNSWHTCEKTHCRAGWIVTLAGAEGRALESFYNTELAAMLIYDASAPGFKINPARFYDNNADALTDMKKLAESSAKAINLSEGS